MPVGCLGNAARGAKEEPFRKNGTDNFETILTSSRLNSSDQFAFMQHTLLLQIFRDPDDEDQTRSSPSSDESGGSLLCPTCVGFSDQCCQQDNGIDIFNSFIEANLNCHWDLKLSEAISSLRWNNNQKFWDFPEGQDNLVINIYFCGGPRQDKGMECQGYPKRVHLDIPEPGHTNNDTKINRLLSYTNHSYCWLRFSEN